jgi:APA family basic amino acid/polyamine antiporter
MYGVGNILGAGVYALIGEVVGITGNFSWFAFILASVVGGLTGLSYAELSAMYPQSAAEFVYVDKAFRKRAISFLLGWVNIFAGLLSGATVALSFGAYLADLLGWPHITTVIPLAAFLVIILSVINYIGIKESTWTNILFTLIEAGGLVIIIIIGLPFLGSVNYLAVPSVAVPAPAILSAVSLIFFAYIGFEDIANVAEESVNPGYTLPRAILYSMIISTVLYCLVAISVVSVLPYTVIAGSPAPLNDVAAAVLGPTGGVVLSLIALFATGNTVLITLIVTSRMMYGMARDKALPGSLAKLVPSRKTPSNAILLSMIVTLGMLFLGELSVVANATVIGVLLTFIGVNLSVIMLRKTQPDLPRSFKLKPSFRWVPITALLGTIVCIVLLFTFDLFIVGVQLVIVVIGIVVYFFLPSRNANTES